MAYSKIKKILFIILCLFVILFPFWCVRGLCSETEELSFDIINGIRIRTDTNYFVTADNYWVGYLEVEKGYKYYITKSTGGSATAPIAFSSSTPAVNVTYDYVTSIAPGESYSFIPTNNDLLLVCFNTNSNGTTITVTREKLTDMSGTVQELASVVSLSAIWGIFDISINYIVIAVCVAFGIFIIFKLIRKLSKGKEGF